MVGIASLCFLNKSNKRNENFFGKIRRAVKILGKRKENVSVFYYGSMKLRLGMKLPKYNLSYNTRDLIKSLAEDASD